MYNINFAWQINLSKFDKNEIWSKDANGFKADQYVFASDHDYFKRVQGFK